MPDKRPPADPGEQFGDQSFAAIAVQFQLRQISVALFQPVIPHRRRQLLLVQSRQFRADRRRLAGKPLLQQLFRLPAIGGRCFRQRFSRFQQRDRVKVKGQVGRRVLAVAMQHGDIPPIDAFVRQCRRQRQHQLLGGIGADRIEIACSLPQRPLRVAEEDIERHRRGAVVEYFDDQPVVFRPVRPGHPCFGRQAGVVKQSAASPAAASAVERCNSPPGVLHFHASSASGDSKSNSTSAPGSGPAAASNSSRNASNLKRIRFFHMAIICRD